MSLYWSKIIVVWPKLLFLMLVPSRCIWQKCTHNDLPFTQDIWVSPDHKGCSPPHCYCISTAVQAVFATLWHSLLEVCSCNSSCVREGHFLHSMTLRKSVAILENCPTHKHSCDREETIWKYFLFSQACYWAVVAIRPTAHFTQSLEKLWELVNGFLQHTEQVTKRSALHKRVIHDSLPCKNVEFIFPVLQTKTSESAFQTSVLSFKFLLL